MPAEKTIKTAFAACLLAAALPLCVSSQAQQITQQRIDAKAAEIVDFIKSRQQPDGSFKYVKIGTDFQLGMTALALLALRTADVPVDDPSVERAANFLSRYRSDETYDESLVVCALEKMDPVAFSSRIEKSFNFLLSCQRKDGGWGYGPARESFETYMDESCSQYSILGLSSAERCGFELQQSVKSRGKDYYYGVQNKDGGWGYRHTDSTLSMTFAGLASLRLLGDELETPVQGRCGDYDSNPAMGKALLWAAPKIKPFLGNVQKAKWGYYTLYGLERAAILNGIKDLDGVDWYKAGCANLLSNPGWQTDLASACFSLLFIAKNSAPYAIGKWRWDGASARHRYDAANWAELASRRLKTPLDWQNVDLGAPGGSEAARRCSMLFASGHSRFNVSQTELAALRDFLDAGGVFVGEACCGDKEFAESFTRLMEERLYPGKGMKLQPVSPSHPIMSCCYPLSSLEEPLLVLGKGCGRRQVFLLARGISCSLNGERKGSKTEASDLKAATNILVYSLGRHKPQSKFSEIPPPSAPSLEDELNARALAGDGAAFKFENPLGRVRFKGDWNTDPLAIPALRKSFEKTPSLPSFDSEIPVDPEKDDIFACQTLYLSGHGFPEISAKGLVNLRRYLQSGGRLFAEACCSDRDFDEGFRRLAASLLPGRSLEPVPSDDPLWTRPFDLKARTPSCSKAWLQLRGAKWPELLGVRDGASWALLYSPSDISCGLDGDLEDDIPGLGADSGAALWANVLSALLQADSGRKPLGEGGEE